MRITIADYNYLSRIGLKCHIKSRKSWELVSEVADGKLLIEDLKLRTPDVLIIDFASETFHIDLLRQIQEEFRHTYVLAITPRQDKNTVLKAMNYGVTSYLLKECDAEEIEQAIEQTAKAKKFVCSKVLDQLVNELEINATENIHLACDGALISDREMEIVKLIAEGYSNKQIADKLFLSNHTISTHRKNIMAKLKVNNTAGLVLYAVKNNLIGPNHFLFS